MTSNIPTWVPVDWTKHSPDVEAVGDVLQEHVVGQDRAIERVLRSLESQFANLRDANDNSPFLVFLFPGPTGVGKTELTRALTKALIGDMDAFTRVNCTEYQDRHTIYKLIGAPPGYVGFREEPVLSQRRLDQYDLEQTVRNKPKYNLYFKERLAKLLAEMKQQGWELVEDMTGIHFEALIFVNPKTGQALIGSSEIDPPKGWRKQTLRHSLTEVIGDLLEEFYEEKIGAPYRSILLLDEIEKAHPALWNILLQVGDAGSLGMAWGDGKVSTDTDFQNTGIIMTSNVGANRIQQYLAGSQIGYDTSTARDSDTVDQDIYEIAREAAKKTFAPEFLGRIEQYDGFIVFRPLQRGDYEQILDIRLRILYDTLARAGCPLDIQLTPAACDFLLDEGTSPQYGARGLKKEIYKRIRQRLAPRINDETLQRGQAVRFDINDDGDDLVFFRTTGPAFEPPPVERPKSFQDELADFAVEAWRRASRRQTPSPPTDAPSAGSAARRIPVSEEEQKPTDSPDGTERERDDGDENDSE